MNEVIQKVVQRGHVTDREGNQKLLAGAVTEGEANYLYDLICHEGLKRTLETGVANGLSTLAMTLAVKSIDGHHIGIDPCQATDHNETALVLLEEFNVDKYFTLMDGPAHTEMPKLMDNESKFDLIFIDGMHLFDYKLVDVFLADMVLRDGGWLLLHDLLIPSVKKTLRYLLRHRDYEMIMTPDLRPTAARRARYVAGAFLKQRAMWYSWPNGFSNLLVLRKKSSPDHNWDFFRNF